jgi:hypothetical protein
MISTGNSKKPWTNYLSPAPHALPQAAGFSSGLSAPPHAAGASAGLSEPPQAVPQADAAASSTFFVQPNKFESAIVYDLLNVFSGRFLPSVFLIIHIFSLSATTYFFITRLPKGNFLNFHIKIKLPGNA